MNFTAYLQIFQNILDDPNPLPPYNNPDYLNYTKLNWSRQQRWLKLGVLNGALVTLIQSFNKKQFWTIITEPWCGDAAHTVPFLQQLADLNPLISVDYQQRDSEPLLINNYLTNGSKSIPKLIITDEDNKQLGVWGPRPAGCQLLFEQLVKEHVEMEQKKIALQQWYNADKGVSLQKELIALLSNINF
jgi:hypothetical protein